MLAISAPICLIRSSGPVRRAPVLVDNLQLLPHVFLILSHLAYYLLSLLILFLKLLPSLLNLLFLFSDPLFELERLHFVRARAELLSLELLTKQLLLGFFLASNDFLSQAKHLGEG